MPRSSGRSGCIGMYRNLFYFFVLTSFAGLGMCFLNLARAVRTMRRKRPSNGLGAATAVHRVIQQGGHAYIAFLLFLLSLAVLKFSDPGNAPSSSTGWILYGVLWSILLTIVGLSWNQRRFEEKIRTYPLEKWNGTERRGPAP
jgi:hypothetical protein